MTTVSTERPITTSPSLEEQVDRVADVAAEHVRRTDDEAEFPIEALSEMRRTGLLGLLVPAEYGGRNAGNDELIDVSIRLGRVDMSVAMIFAMHCQQVAALVEHATPALRDEVLPEIAAGNMYLASITTEPGKGGHLLTSETELRDIDGQLLLDRFAPIVTGGSHADGFLVTMLSPDATTNDQVSLVFARRDQLTLDQSGDWQPLGMRPSHSVALKLTGRIPPHQVVGDHGAFRDIATSVFAPLAHIGWSACWLGTATGALSRVITLLRSADVRKRTNLDSELLLTRLSKARQQLDVVHALLRHVNASFIATDDPTRPNTQLLLNALKITAAERCYQAVDELVDVMGLRHGYLKDSPTRLEQALRDLRSAALNYSNDRLHLADGKLALLDREVHLA